MREENLTLRVFSALGIVFILCGHLNYGILEIGGLFPYYSFHVYIFLFVAGYFYNASVEEKPFDYVIYKARKLLIPYFAFNLFYGIVSSVCNRCGLFYGGDITLYNLLIAPFHGGHQYMFNAPSWFMIALFEIEVINIIMRKVLKALRLEYDLLIGAIVLAVGIATVYLAIGGHVWGWYKDVGRILIMLPGFYFGLIYRKYVDRIIPERGKWAFIVPCILAVVTCILQWFLCHNMAGLAFSTVWVSSFANGPVIPFVTVLTGISFWLSVSKILTMLLAKGKLFATILKGLVIVGRNTMSIMLHHIFVFFLINLSIWRISQKADLFADFDVELFKTDLYYSYDAGVFSKPLYLILGLVIPLTLCELFRRRKKN